LVGFSFLGCGSVFISVLRYVVSHAALVRMGPGGWLTFALYRRGCVRDGPVVLAMDALPVSNLGFAISCY
jgi:hypothetical protein